MSRLDYAPKLEEIQITDLKRGFGFFTPKSDKPVSLAALKAAIKNAGYTLDRAEITVTGTLTRDGETWLLIAIPTNQRFSLEGTEASSVLAGASEGTRVEITGEWKTTGVGTSARELISPRTMKKDEDATKKRAEANADVLDELPAVKFVRAGFDASPAEEAAPAAAAPVAPIRTTTPGLTVYKGGAIVPRLYFVNQHLGNLDVSRQRLQVSLSYTPSPRLQLEAEVPFSRTSFDDGASSGSGFGLGNITLWSKYRFFRTVKTFGDRQAAARFGLELPTGKKTPPSEAKLNAPEFVRQQLTPISGGLSPHFDIAYSQAERRVVFGGNVEGIIRSERGGFRMGHEMRVNTDLEYVLLPRNYDSPGGELFLILETTFVHRRLGRINGNVVPDSRSTEYYLAPGLQYAAAPRWVIEGSLQIPIIQNTGAQVLRNGTNLLVGIRYLY